MRHRKRKGQLNKQGSHRKALLRNMVRNLMLYQRIKTTDRRARETRRIAEHLITLGKENDLAARRLAFAIIPDRSIVKKLFHEIAPLFKSRQGGYTRIIPVGFRKGDNASMVLLELTEMKVVEKVKKKATEKEKVKEPEAVKEEKPREHPSKPAPKPKAVLHDEKAEQKAKSEDSRMESKKSFLKNLRGYFRRKTDM